jgi:DNA-binding SARP family transcriptional activator
MAMICLLGPPRIERGKEPVTGPRGSKAWALLAYLALARGPVPRSRLVDLMFDEADDPAAALRWTLSQLRRALEGVADVGGDPLALTLAPGTVVDVEVVGHGLWGEALLLPQLGGVLLEGVNPRTGPAFDLWLSTERRRVAGQTAAVLHEAAHARLAQGDAASAVDLAARLVTSDPLAERGHELLVRALVARGDRPAAEARVAQCRALFRRELGTDPSPAVAAALRPEPALAGTASPGAVDAAREGGAGAAHVGAYDHALPLLRSAVQGARRLGDDARLARGLADLGAALVSGVRGSDEEAVSTLHEAVLLARSIADGATAARAALELSHVETLRAHHTRAGVWFGQARSLAGGDPALLAWVDLFAGMGATDVGDYPVALTVLERAAGLARAAADQRAATYVGTALGRLHLLRGQTAVARSALESACEVATGIGWLSFLPFPRALLAEVLLLDGDLVAAEAAFDRSYALACQVGDPCWESYSLRGRGLLAAERGEDAVALDLLVAAPAACRRLPDAHDWVEGHCMDALCGFAVTRGLGTASGWVRDLEDFASRRGLRELVARAALHRAALGQPGAAELAAVLAADIDNPVLHDLVTRARPQATPA